VNTPCCWKRNDICTIILVQLLHNFLSHTHIMFLFSLHFSLTIIFDHEKREQQSCLKSCIKMVVKISLLLLELRGSTSNTGVLTTKNWSFKLVQNWMTLTILLHSIQLITDYIWSTDEFKLIVGTKCSLHWSNLL